MYLFAQMMMVGSAADGFFCWVQVISDGYGQVTVLFADLVGWTDIARSMSPVDSIQLLGDIVSTFDRIAHIHKVEKIKTIGDGKEP